MGADLKSGISDYASQSIVSPIPPCLPREPEPLKLGGVLLSNLVGTGFYFSKQT